MHDRAIGTLAFMGAAVVLIAAYLAILAATRPECPRFSTPTPIRGAWVCALPPLAD